MLYKDGGSVEKGMAFVKRHPRKDGGRQLLARGEMGSGWFKRSGVGRGRHPLRLGVCFAEAFRSDPVGCIWISRTRG